MTAAAIGVFGGGGQQRNETDSGQEGSSACQRTEPVPRLVAPIKTQALQCRHCRLFRA
jgi:hypothetical protein